MNYYKTVFAMQQYHKWDINTIEDMPPFERDLYIEMIAESLKDKQQAPDEEVLKDILSKKGTHKMSKPTNDELNKIMLEQGYG